MKTKKSYHSTLPPIEEVFGGFDEAVKDLNKTIKESRAYAKETSAYAKSQLEESKRILDRTEKGLSKAQADLDYLNKTITEGMKDTKDIGSRLKPLFQKADELIDYFRKNKVIPILFIIAGIFFLSPNLTGNVIGNLTNSTSNWIGGVLFALGILGFFILRK